MVGLLFHPCFCGKGVGGHGIFDKLTRTRATLAFVDLISGSWNEIPGVAPTDPKVFEYIGARYRIIPTCGDAANHDAAQA